MVLLRDTHGEIPQPVRLSESTDGLCQEKEQNNFKQQRWSCSGREDGDVVQARAEDLCEISVHHFLTAPNVLKTTSCIYLKNYSLGSLFSSPI